MKEGRDGYALTGVPGKGPAAAWLLAILCLGYGLFLLAFRSQGHGVVVFDAGRWPTGPVGEGTPLFIYSPETGSATIKEENGERYLHVSLRDPERYFGFGLLNLEQAGSETVLRIVWRSQAHPATVQLDVREGDPRDWGNEFWEVFSRQVESPGENWTTLEVPLSEIPPNQNY